MGIDAILRSAISGLNTSQSALRTTADNIANVNTPSYARKTIQQETLVVAGKTAGVKLSGIRRVVDEFIQTQLRTASSQAERYDAMSEIYRQVSVLFGNPSDNNSITGRLDKIFRGLTDLVIEPDSTVRRIGAITDITNFGAEVDRLASQFQLLRKEADRQVAADVDLVNDNLSRIKTLNEQIRYEVLQGNEASGLADQRAQALEKIAKVMDIRTSELSSGEISIATTDGVVLLDANLRKLVYTEAGTVTSSSRFSQITVNVVDSSTGTVASTGTALDPRLQSGSLRGWLDMRDQVLPDMALQLGEFSGRVVDELNRVHNDNSAVPAPNALTGRNTGLVGTDLIGFTGAATFALVDSNQAIVTTVDVDFDAATYSVNGGGAVAFSGTTLADLVSDVNTGFGGGATLALSGGAMSLTATTSTSGVVIQQDSTTPSDRGGRGFSYFFGMNDVVEASVEASYDTGLGSASAHGFGSSGTATFELRGPNNEVAKTFSLDFSSVGGTAMSDVLTSLNNAALGYVTFTLDSDGALVATKATSYTDYRLNITNDTTDRASTGVTFDQFFGVSDKYRANAALDVVVRSDILASPAKLALADLDTSAASGTPALSIADGRGAIAFQEVIDRNVSFNAAGGLAAITTTLGNYGGSVLANTAIGSEQVDKLKGDRAMLYTELKVRNDEVSGVNLDEELSNMIIYQNAYNASARMISTSRELYDVLMQLVG